MMRKVPFNATLGEERKISTMFCVLCHVRIILILRKLKDKNGSL